MATQLSPIRTDLPPPRQQLLHDERPVAWLSGNHFGFSGFANAREAAYAAWVAHRTVSRKLAPVLGVRPTPIDVEPLSIEWRDGREMILASRRPIAALVRPDADDATALRWFSFSSEVPSGIGDPLMRDVVHAAHRALLKSGISWSMIRPRRNRACPAQLRPTTYGASPSGADPGRRRPGAERSGPDDPIRSWKARRDMKGYMDSSRSLGTQGPRRLHSSVPR